MDFFPAIIIISVIGGIISIDTASGWQVMISQPVVSCPIIGWIFGDLQLGLLMGVLLELPWLINIPLGGVHGSEGNLGAVVATALSLYLKSKAINTENIIVISSIMYSLIISRVGIFLVEYVRKINLNLIHSADRAALNGDLTKITWLNLTGLSYSFILGFFLVGVGCTLGMLLLRPLVAFIHPEFNFAFGLAQYGLLGLGVGVVATLFINRETHWYFVVPFLVSASILVVTLIF